MDGVQLAGFTAAGRFAGVQVGGWVRALAGHIPPLLGYIFLFDSSPVSYSHFPLLHFPLHSILFYSLSYFEGVDFERLSEFARFFLACFHSSAQLRTLHLKKINYASSFLPSLLHDFYDIRITWVVPSHNTSSTNYLSTYPQIQAKQTWRNLPVRS